MPGILYVSPQIAESLEPSEMDVVLDLMSGAGISGQEYNPEDGLWRVRLDGLPDGEYTMELQRRNKVCTSGKIVPVAPSRAPLHV